MCNACTPILVGVSPSVSEIKFGELFFWTMNHGCQKFWLKKFMQVMVDEICMLDLGFNAIAHLFLIFL